MKFLRKLKIPEVLGGDAQRDVAKSEPRLAPSMERKIIEIP